MKTMTNGEYLRLCQKHSVAPIYLDKMPKRAKRKQAKPQSKTTFGRGFVLVTPANYKPPKDKKRSSPRREPQYGPRRQRIEFIPSKSVRTVSGGLPSLGKKR
jgi:hypothetical protein